MSAEAFFDPTALLAEASAQAGGLGDFGDASFRPALEQVCEAYEKQSQLTDMGRGLLKQKLVGHLANRLRIEDYFKRHPEIAQESIGAPLVIVGLPRTGTTRLQRLLSRDQRFWSMLFWESQFPVPLPDETLQQPTVRIAHAKGIVDYMVTSMPKLLAIHPMAAEEADEEVMLMEHSFLSAFDSYADVPDYVAWLDAQDQTPAYVFLKRCLQFLQWQKRQRGITGQRWLLKTPHHLLRMDILLKVFPSVQVILTHRDPVQTIPSIASFIDTLWRIYGTNVDAGAAGRSWSERMARGLRHTMKVRQQAPPGQFLDVDFRDTVKAPMEVVRRIYEFIGWPLTAEVEAAMRAWLAEDEKQHDAKGGHEYTPEQFGLSEAQLRKDFAEYRTAMCHPEERSDEGSRSA
ncbi:MAG TPA: sulfotransferase [Verrucomicrobiae bacterium]|nr:sulfotransferase [Verrucomicrobiae bacterium]